MPDDILAKQGILPLDAYSMTLPTEQTELDGLRRLDSQVIGAVFDRYYPDVYRFVRYRQNDDAIAEDLASDVFVRLLEAVKAGRGPETNLKAWLLATAAHLTTDQLRKKYRRPEAELSETAPDAAPGPAHESEQRERNQHLKNAMSTLTEEQQQVLTFRFNHSYSLEETAALMKKNVNAVKQLQFRALAALNRALGDLL
jgi:RNA polymerase sigma-70 factor, ECF subfamily